MWKVLSIVVVVVALIFAVFGPNEPAGEKQDAPAQAIAALQKITHNAKVQYKKLAIGYNTNVDLIVDGVAVLKALRVDPTATKPHPHSSLQSLQAFQDTFSHFFAEGSAAERLIENDSLCQDIVAAAQMVPGMFSSAVSLRPVAVQKRATQRPAHCPCFSSRRFHQRG